MSTTDGTMPRLAATGRDLANAAAERVERVMSTSSQPRRQSRSRREVNPADENLRAVARLEERARAKRSAVACVSDLITSCAGNEWSVAAHAIWFGAWILFNTGVLPLPWEPFDPFPFSLLTSIVSLEAIFLTLFVLASQNRLTLEADKRAHLDLQVDLLAEQEMTVLLRMLRELCEHFELEKTTASDEFRALIERTDVGDLAERVEKNLQPAAETGSS
jgi:uncharacterized membrane protein